MLQLIVHRGTNIKCPENSICGIKEIREITKDAIIEIDIVPTKDNKLVLFHDFSLSRLCKIDKLIFDFTFEELNQVQSEYEFVELQEILNKFPSQKFLLDIRCGYHVDFFRESNIDIDLIKEDLFEKYRQSLQKITINNLILSCSELNMAKRFYKELNLDVDLSENYMRNFLADIEQNVDLSFLEFPLKRVNIQNKFLTHKLVDIFHKNNIEVFSTPSMPRSIQNSKIMLKKAQEYGCDGVWLSPIDSDIIKYIKGTDA